MVVFTRGVISDIQDVTDEIVRASHYPLSIIIVGVGKNNDTKFDKLRNLDGEDTEEEWVEDDDGNKKDEDPEYEVKLLRYKMQISKYGRDLDEWSKNVKNWKNNRSHMFAIVLQHCPADLVQRLKSKDL